MQTAFVCAAVSMAGALALAAPAAAQARGEAATPIPITLRGGLGTAVFVHGDVDSDAPAPEYGDAFGPSFALRLEADARLSPMWSVHAGAGYERHFGDRAGNAEFDDLELLPSWVGGKLLLPLPRPERFAVYGRADIGWAITMPVDFESEAPPGTRRRVELYDADVVFLFGLGVGASLTLPDRPITLGLEFGYRLLTGPEVSGSSSGGEPAGAFAMLLNVGYRF